MTGNGSTELISLLITQRNARHALVIGPTYSEYERELSLTGGRISNYDLEESQEFRIDLRHLECALDDDVDFLILCNPNNPTSTCITNKSMRLILDACLQHGIYVMADETYVEFADNTEQITSIHLTNYYSN